jgi:hypothetical protein
VNESCLIYFSNQKSLEISNQNHRKDGTEKYTCSFRENGRLQRYLFVHAQKIHFSIQATVLEVVKWRGSCRNNLSNQYAGGIVT